MIVHFGECTHRRVLLSNIGTKSSVLGLTHSKTYLVGCMYMDILHIYIIVNKNCMHVFMKAKWILTVLTIANSLDVSKHECLYKAQLLIHDH